MSCLVPDQNLAMLDGALDPDERSLVDEHLDRCDSCLELVALIADDSDEARTLLPAHPPEETESYPSGELAPGERVDEFEVIERIGRGGMGAVYLAHDTKLQRRVALKVIASEHVVTPKDAERFMREARTTARVSHPSIVTIHTVGEHGGVPYLALEYVRGEPLRKWMRAKRGEEEIARLGAEIAEALAEAHRYGVFHRDLKPENVLIDRSGRVRLLDFGLAETVAVEDPPTSVRGAASALDLGPNVTGLAGTPRYMAPEQWRESSGTGATDIWALGIILYELLGDGRHPFSDRREVTAIAQVMSQPLPSPPELEGVSTPLAEVVRRCLREDPDERLTAVEAKTMLRAMAQDSMESLESVPAVTAAPTLPSKAKAVGGVLALLLGAAVGVVVLQPSSSVEARSFGDALSVDVPAATPATIPIPASSVVAPAPPTSATATATSPPSSPRPRPEVRRPKRSAAVAPPPSLPPPPPPPSSLLREW